MAFVESAFGFSQQDLFASDSNAIGLLIGPVGSIGLIPRIGFPTSTTSGYSVSASLAVPAGAVVDRAVVHVVGDTPNRTAIGGVATVRAAAGDPEDTSDSMIVDFGVMRNVSEVEAPVAISSATPWLGTAFADEAFLEVSSAVATLQELQTERLLLTLDEPVSPAELAGGFVTTSTPPADLELLVAGTRAWFRQGPAPAGFAIDVDITAAVQSTVTSGVSPVPLVLQARVPGHLELAPAGDVQFLRTHVVQFSQGETTTSDAAEEGIVDVALPLPPGSETWTIHRVVATVAAEDRGPERVLPSVGPTALVDAELTLDPDRRLAVHLPAAALAPFATLTAVRVRLRAGAAGIGVAGGLLNGTALLPGAPVPGGEVTEVSVAPSNEAGWVTLPFAKALSLPADGNLWLSISATRGEAALGLQTVEPLVVLDAHDQPVSDDARGIAVIRRIAPNGVAKAMSAPTGVRTDALALRLVGTAPSGQPIDLLSVGLAGRSDDGTAVVDLATTIEPGDGPDRYVRALPTPASVAELTLRTVVLGATRVTVGPVVVAYDADEE